MVAKVMLEEEEEKEEKMALADKFAAQPIKGSFHDLRFTPGVRCSVILYCWATVLAHLMGSAAAIPCTANTSADRLKSLLNRLMRNDQNKGLGSLDALDSGVGARTPVQIC